MVALQSEDVSTWVLVLVGAVSTLADVGVSAGDVVRVA